MSDIVGDLMREATRLTQAGRLHEATEVIQRALGLSAGVGTGTNAVPVALPQRVGVDHSAPPVKRRTWPSTVPVVDVEDESDEGSFTNGAYIHALNTHFYKLYVPPGAAGRTLPLVVMLHGGSQDPDDFAAGTGMNEAGRSQGFFVLYPAQSQAANPGRCWNWFNDGDQRRDGGEPCMLAGMTEAVIKEHGIDRRRVYIAGLSAGGAMATIVAEAYPKIFAAVGVHSGLPRGAASNFGEAYAVMSSGEAIPRMNADNGTTSSEMARQARVPTIVFHGDDDRTVHPRNGEQVIAAALSKGKGRIAGKGAKGRNTRGEDVRPVVASPHIERRVSAQGRHYTRTTHLDDRGKTFAEHWLVHGAGHAWSGGDSAGSYTDANGPDATRAMLRFFFSHAKDPAIDVMI